MYHNINNVPKYTLLKRIKTEDEIIKESDFLNCDYVFFIINKTSYATYLTEVTLGKNSNSDVLLYPINNNTKKLVDYTHNNYIYKNIEFIEDLTWFEEEVNYKFKWFREFEDLQNNFLYWSFTEYQRGEQNLFLMHLIRYNERNIFVYNNHINKWVQFFYFEDEIKRDIMCKYGKVYNFIKMNYFSLLGQRRI